MADVIYARMLDYNSFEGTLLSSAIFVTLAGVCFESGRLDDEFYVLQRDILTWVTIIVVSMTLAYMATIFGYDVIVTIDSRQKATLCAGCVDKRRIKTAKKARQSVYEMQSRLDGEDDDDDNQQGMSLEKWDRFREDFTKVESIIEDLKMQLEAAKKQRDQSSSAARSDEEKSLLARAGLSRTRLAPLRRKGRRQFGQVQAAGESSSDQATIAEAARVLNPTGAPRAYGRAMAVASSRREGAPTGVIQGRKSKHDMSTLRKAVQRRESSAAAMSLMKRDAMESD
jgi:hypothetical protein